MTKIKEKLNALEVEKKKLLEQLDKQRANKTFLCGCGAMHKIKECDAIQDHWYERPSGCYGGDHWHQDELSIICPVTNIRNRVYFPSPSYENRKDYRCNPGEQFKDIYKRLFKSVTDEFSKSPEGTRVYREIMYFAKNLKRFDLTDSK